MNATDVNAADEARLALAKRAYQATQPRELEVQTGVRRARLALLRPKRRRNWFSRGLVLVVLALGSLAYAKPHGLAELVERLAPRSLGADHGAAAHGGSVLALEQAHTGDSAATQHKPLAAAPPPGLAATATPLSAAPKTLKRASQSAVAKAAASTASRVTQAHGPAAPASATNDANGAPASAVSDWGRVGQALAQGDDAAALSALKELSQSNDDATRDKADLGRAQLLLAHGEVTEGCALARSLTHRRAGGRIERQAALLLEACAR